MHSPLRELSPSVREGLVRVALLLAAAFAAFTAGLREATWRWTGTILPTTWADRCTRRAIAGTSENRRLRKGASSSSGRTQKKDFMTMVISRRQVLRS